MVFLLQECPRSDIQELACPAWSSQSHDLGKAVLEQCAMPRGDNANNFYTGQDFVSLFTTGLVGLAITLSKHGDPPTRSFKRAREETAGQRNTQARIRTAERGGTGNQSPQGRAVDLMSPNFPPLN